MATTGPATQEETDLQSQASSQTASATNDTFVRHRDPETIDRETRLKDLQRALRDRLEDRLADSAVEISQGQYEQAQSLLGQAYLNQFEKYADVAAARNDDSATSVGETLNETRTRQREYARTVGEFRETSRQYREAKRQGDEERARRLARRIVDLGKQAQKESGTLDESYDRLETATEANVTTARERIQEVQIDINQTRQTIERREFTSTTLEVREADTQGSFVDPLEIEATLTGVDGPISNRNITLRIGNRSYAATTDVDGEFTVQYRPVTIPANSSTVTIAYLPANNSVYLGSNASIPVRINSVTGQTVIDTATVETAFGEPVAVSGTVTVANEPISGLPLAVMVGGQQLGTVVTAQNGSFVFNRRLPAGPDAGEQTLTVRTDTAGRSVSAATTTRSIRIQGTPTSLSATTTRNGEVIQISGQLTADASPLSGRQITVSASGEDIETVRTRANGTYIVRIDDAELNRAAIVKFDGAGTNLNSTETSVLVPPGRNSGPNIDPDAQPSSPETLQDWVSRLINLLIGGGLTSVESGQAIIIVLLTSPIVLFIGGILVGIGGGMLVIIQNRRRSAADLPDTTMSSDSSESASMNTTRSSVDLSALFRSVEAEFEAGNYTEAIIHAYGIARTALVNKQRLNQVRTHWQFFETCVANGVDTDVLRTLTEAYETARYGRETVSAATAKAALDAARTFVDSEADPNPGGPEE